MNSWQSHIPPISQTTLFIFYQHEQRLWIADKVISPLYHKQLINGKFHPFTVVNSWQSHIPPISQTTASTLPMYPLRLWIADKVISPLYHNQLLLFLIYLTMVVNSWQSHIPPISQTTTSEERASIGGLWIADKVISPLYHKQLSREQYLLWRGCE